MARMLLHPGTNRCCIARRGISDCKQWNHCKFWCNVYYALYTVGLPGCTPVVCIPVAGGSMHVACCFQPAAADMTAAAPCSSLIVWSCRPPAQFQTCICLFCLRCTSMHKRLHAQMRHVLCNCATRVLFESCVQAVHQPPRACTAFTA